jgi:hypothetical protein
LFGWDVAASFFELKMCCVCRHKAKIDRLEAEKKESQKRTAMMEKIAEQNAALQRMLSNASASQQPQVAFFDCCSARVVCSGPHH